MRCARTLGWIALALLLAPRGPSAAERPAGRVVLIGVDGGSWNLLDPRLTGGQLPHLAALIRRGVSAELETVEPVISPTVWSSIATGRTPEHHGIRSFASTRTQLAVPTVFERLARAGLRVGLYDYLVTWPPRALPDGFVVPGWLRRDLATSPRDVWTRIEVDPFVTRYDDLSVNADYLALAEREVVRKPAVFNALSRAFELEVAAVTFYALDMTAHRAWHGLHPEAFPDLDPPATEAERRAVPNAVAGVDRAIGEIVAELGPDDVAIVVSDHGFRARDEPDVRWVSRMEPFIEGAGLDAARDRFTVVSTFGLIGLSVAAGDFAEQDAVYEALYDAIRSAETAVGQPLYSVYRVDVADRPPGAERGLVERFRQWAVARLLDWRFGVEIGDDLHGLVFATPEAGVLEPLAADAEVRVRGEPVSRGSLIHPQRFTGEHDPIGIFIAAGGPIAARPERQRVSVLDVAPLLLYLTGHGIPGDLEGALPRGMLRAEVLAERPPERVAPEQLPGLPPETRGIEAETLTPELREKLRSLGYLE